MTPTPARRVLVLGGSGFLGRSLVPALDTAGFDVTVATRRREDARHLIVLPRARVVQSRLRESADLDALLAGQDAVINLVGILHGRTGADGIGPDFRAAHVTLVQQLVQAMQRQGVSRLIHVSALGVSDDPARAPSAYLRSKSQGEQAVRALAGGGWTILRPSVVFGPGDSFLTLFAGLQSFLPVMMLPGAQAEFQPVYSGDVVQALLRCLQDPAQTTGATFELAGPSRYRLDELVRMAGRLARPERGPRPIIPLSSGLAGIMAAVMERLPGPTLISRDNLRSMEVPNVAQGAPDPRLGITPTPLEQIAPRYLGPIRSDWNAERVRARR